ncbi:MAG: hypothetical protein ABIQ90_02170, partial [Polaromonas sp.]
MTRAGLLLILIQRNSWLSTVIFTFGEIEMASTHLLRWGALVTMAFLLTACAMSPPHRTLVGDAGIDCSPDSMHSPERCFNQTPEVSASAGYTLHFVELDDQGWLYPASGADKMGQAHGQIDRAMHDVSLRLKNGESIRLLIYVHGWKHTAAYDDRDVQRFRQMLADAALLNRAEGKSRSVIGIYVGWRGRTVSRSNPLVYSSFWTRKNAALHVSEGASRELFARVRALRERWNVPRRALPGAGANPSEAAAAEQEKSQLLHPRIRTVVIGHSFGAWVAYSALSPSLMELLAHSIDAETTPEVASEEWLTARLRQAADMVILINPAFEASRYQPLQQLANSVRLSRHVPPILVLVTSEADAATRIAFPLGRRVNTLFQHPFVTDEQVDAAMRTPGFVDRYVTHRLSRPATQASTCKAWKNAPVPHKDSDQIDQSAEIESQRVARMKDNGKLELDRHQDWRNYLQARNFKLTGEWSWEYCGGTVIKHKPDAAQSPVWNVVTDASVIRSHSDIMGEPLHSFLRQLYLEL